MLPDLYEKLILHRLLTIQVEPRRFAQLSLFRPLAHERSKSRYNLDRAVSIIDSPRVSLLANPHPKCLRGTMSATHGNIPRVEGSR